MNYSEFEEKLKQYLLENKIDAEHYIFEESLLDIYVVEFPHLAIKQYF